MIYLHKNKCGFSTEPHVVFNHRFLANKLQHIILALSQIISPSQSHKKLKIFFITVFVGIQKKKD